MRRYHVAYIFASLATLSLSTPTLAAKCYAKVGSACVTKSYGDLDSSCQNPCAIGKTAKKVQDALKARGFDPGPVDGNAGAKTREALRAFQKQEKISPTGKMNKATLERLDL